MTDSEKPFLSARELHKSYALEKRSLEVLCGVSLDVKRGEFVALKGSSGAGKSTLLHLLGALDVPNAGEVWIKGHNLARSSDSNLCLLRNQMIGFIFQAYHLLPELSAIENVSIAARMARVSASEAQTTAARLLDRVGLGERKNHRPSELSGGEQQRVAIARALVNDPELILADEPTGNLDSHTGDGILELLCDLRAERGVTLIIATHDAAVAEAAARLVELVDGKVVGSMESGI